MGSDTNLIANRGRLVATALRIGGAGRLAALAGAMSLFAGFMVGSLFPFAIGALALVVVVAGRCFSRKIWAAAAEEEATRPIEFPARTGVFDGTARALLGRLELARMQLEQVLAADDPRKERSNLLGIRHVRELERAAVAALLRLEYLASAPTLGKVAAPPEDTVAEWPAAAGPLLKRTAAVKAERQRALDEIEMHRREALARVEYLTACLEAIPAELMELRVLKAEALERTLPDPIRDADLFREDVQQMKQELAG